MTDFSKLQTGWYYTSNENFRYVFINIEESDAREALVECALTSNGSVKILTQNVDSDGWHFRVELEKLGTISFIDSFLLPAVISKELMESYQDPLTLCNTILLVAIARFSKKCTAIKISRATTMKTIFEGVSIQGVMYIILNYLEISTHDSNIPSESSTLEETANWMIEQLGL